jgi:hypothetical protein
MECLTTHEAVATGRPLLISRFHVRFLVGALSHYVASSRSSIPARSLEMREPHVPSEIPRDQHNAPTVLRQRDIFERSRNGAEPFDPTGASDPIEHTLVL